MITKSLKIDKISLLLSNIFFGDKSSTRKSSIPYMQRLLNEEDNMIKSISYASELCQDPDSITIENLNYL